MLDGIFLLSKAERIAAVVDLPFGNGSMGR